MITKFIAIGHGRRKKLCYERNLQKLKNSQSHKKKEIRAVSSTLLFSFHIVFSVAVTNIYIYEWESGFWTGNLTVKCQCSPIVNWGVINIHLIFFKWGFNSYYQNRVRSYVTIMCWIIFFRAICCYETNKLLFSFYKGDKK